MTQLGTHETHLVFLDHSRNRIGSFLPRDVSDISWSRVKNEFSQATISLTASPQLCNDLEPWLHQVALFRNDEPVWRGFVATTAARENQLTVVARDPSWVFGKRRVATSRSWIQADPTEIVEHVLRDALAAWDPFGLVQQAVFEPTRIPVDYKCVADEVLVSDVLKDMVDAGMQWTVTGGRLVVGPAPRFHITAPITDRDLDAKPTVEKDGTLVVNDLKLLGKGASGQYWDLASGFEGVLQGIDKADALTTEWQLVNEARRQIRNRSAAPRRIVMPGSSRLLPNAPVSLTELVPGCLVPVQTETTGILISSRMELVSVDVKAGAGGDEVSVTIGEEPVELQLQELLSPTRTNWDQDQ